MSAEKRKFSLGDIIRKLNEGPASEQAQASPASMADSGNPLRAQPGTEINPFTPLENSVAPPLANRSDSAANAIQTHETSLLPEQPVLGQRPAPAHVSSTASPRQPSPALSSVATHVQTLTAAPGASQSPPVQRPIGTAESAEMHLSRGPGMQDPPDMEASPLSDAGEEEEFDFFKYLAVIMRRRVPILIITFIAGLYSAWSYMGGAKLFTAKARMLYRPAQQNVINDRQATYVAYGDREKAINTHLLLLKSRTVVKQVSENIGGQLSPEAIAGGLVVGQGGEEATKNDIIEVSFKSTKADLARDVVNDLCKTYIEYRREVNEQEKGRFIFKLQTQIDKVQNELNAREDSLRHFREVNRLVEMTSETNLSVQKFSSMDLARQETEIGLVESQRRYAATRNQLSEQEARIIESMNFNNAYQERLADLELQLISLSAEYNPTHFKIRMVRQQIDSIRVAMKSEIQNQVTRQNTLSKDEFRLSLIEELAKLAIEKTVLESKVAEQKKIMVGLEVDLNKLPALTQRYVNLQRETEALVQTLRTMKQSIEEAKINRDSQESDLKILEFSDTPRHAVSNKKKNSIFIGILVGFILGIALAFLIEYLDQSLKNPADVEKILEIPLIGFVPLIQAEKALIDDSEKLAKSVIEPFRAVRANLKHLASKYHMQAMMVCSAVKGEGKTTLAANLAITYALDGKSVILVDCDLRRPQIHKLFGVSKEVGVAEYLQNIQSVDEIIKPTRHKGLSIITCGKQPDNPAELVGTLRFDDLIADLRTKADIVLFDSPAILPVSDAITMAPKMDGILMVVRTFWTPIKAAKQARNQLRRVGGKVFGGILNGVSHSRSYYPYYYGYYGYYSYKYSYDYDRDPKKAFSFRELGLTVESKLKEGIQNFWLYLPHYVAVSSRFLSYLARKPLFWILLMLGIGLIFVELAIRPSKDAVIHGIEYLSGADVPGAKPGAGGEGNGVALEESGASQTPGLQDRSFDEVETVQSLFLKDSVLQWGRDFNARAAKAYFNHYDSSGFSYVRGDFIAFRNEMLRIFSNKAPTQGIINIDSVAIAGFKVPFGKTVAYTWTAVAGDTFRTSIIQIWKNRDDVWRIVRQSERE